MTGSEPDDMRINKKSEEEQAQQQGHSARIGGGDQPQATHHKHRTDHIKQEGFCRKGGVDRQEAAEKLAGNELDNAEGDDGQSKKISARSVKLLHGRRFWVNRAGQSIRLFFTAKKTRPAVFLAPNLSMRRSLMASTVRGLTSSF